MRRALSALALVAILAAVAAPALAASGDIPQRSDIDDKYKWRLERIYATNDAWKEDFTRLEAVVPDLGKYQGRLAESGAVLLEALQVQDEVGKLAERLFVYAYMRHHEDTRVDEYIGMRDRISGLSVQVNSGLAYVEPEILEIPREQLEKMVAGTPGLELYRHYLENIIRQQAHTLDAGTEALLAQAADVTGGFSRVFSAFQNADLTFGTMTDEEGDEVELTQGRYYRFQESSDRRVREDSWRLFYEAYRSFGNTLASNMSGNVKRDVFNARARGYDSAVQASLAPNAIPVEVYRNLVNTTVENIEPLHRYAALRKRMLGVDQLEIWDMAAPLVESSKTDYAYEDAVAMVTEYLEPLGDAYMNPFREAFNQGWVDVYETEGKRGGAYSWGCYTAQPYLLLNYTGSLEDVFTLAHEMGHSMHSYFSWKSQPYVYANYSLFVAEVASTTNEAIMIGKMLEQTEDRHERLALLNHYLEQFRGTFFTQIMFADFELRMHEMEERGEPLTKAALDQLYVDTYRRYFGPAVHVDELYGATWSRIPHFYRNFYVYQYATAYAAATALSKKVLTEGEPAVDSYLSFLRSGSSYYPIEALKQAGVDMTSPQPVIDTIETFDRLLALFEAELEKSE